MTHLELLDLAYLKVIIREKIHFTLFFIPWYLFTGDTLYCCQYQHIYSHCIYARKKRGSLPPLPSPLLFLPQFLSPLF